MSALDTLLAKVDVPSWARTDVWDLVPAELRRRAFLSAGVEKARFHAEFKRRLAELLANARRDGAFVRRDTIVREMQAVAKELGLDTGADDALTNPAAERRLALIVDVNTAQARGYASYVGGASKGAMAAFPCQELVRVAPRRGPRDWAGTWIGAGGKLVGGNRMVALKDDPVWERINRFGVPYPPFDFGSGMGVRDVSRREAIALGVITDAWRPPERLPVESFNARAQADVSNLDRETKDVLLQVFNGKLQERGGVLSWKGAS